MIEDLVLNAFIGKPLRCLRETIELQRKPLGSGLHLAHHNHHILMNTGMRMQVFQRISPEHFQVHHRFCPFFGHADPPFFCKSLHFITGAEADGGHIDIERTLDAPSSRLPHPAPVLERIAHQGIRGNGGDGLVEVLHLHRGERHFFHKPVGTVFRHRDPVARTQHVVRRELYASHQPEDAVFEYQHQHCRRSTQSGKYGSGILVDEDADYQNQAYTKSKNAHHLVNSFQRAVTQGLVLVRNFIKRLQECVDQHQRCDHQVNEACFQQDGKHVGIAIESERQQQVKDDRRNHPGETVQHVIVEQVIVPFRLRLCRQLAHRRNQRMTE